MCRIPARPIASSGGQYGGDACLVTCSAVAPLLQHHPDVVQGMVLAERTGCATIRLRSPWRVTVYASPWWPCLGALVLIITRQRAQPQSHVAEISKL